MNVPCEKCGHPRPTVGIGDGEIAAIIRERDDLKGGVRVDRLVRPAKLYHATTEKKAKLYRQTGAIKAPVRGFDTLQGAMAWSMKVGRVVILEFVPATVYKLPDHHNQFGCAWWNDGDVTDWRCVFSALHDA